MLEEVATLPIKLEQRHVLLHGQVWGARAYSEESLALGLCPVSSSYSSQPFLSWEQTGLEGRRFLIPA
jgi:hypothetical protein